MLMGVLSSIFAVSALLMLVISALGLLRLPDALSRQHAVTKAATLGLSLLIFALMLLVLALGGEVSQLNQENQIQGSDWLIKLSLLLAFLLVTLPLASHALARSSLSETNKEVDSNPN